MTPRTATDRYFWHDTRPIVTPTDLRRPKAEREVLAAHDHPAHAFEGLGVIRACEAYINTVSPEADMEYYFIDPLSKQHFWLKNIATDALGIELYDSYEAQYVFFLSSAGVYV